MVNLRRNAIFNRDYIFTDTQTMSTSPQIISTYNFKLAYTSCQNQYRNYNKKSNKDFFIMVERDFRERLSLSNHHTLEFVKMQEVRGVANEDLPAIQFNPIHDNVPVDEIYGLTCYFYIRVISHIAYNVTHTFVSHNTRHTHTNIYDNANETQILNYIIEPLIAILPSNEHIEPEPEPAAAVVAVEEVEEVAAVVAVEEVELCCICYSSTCEEHSYYTCSHLFCNGCITQWNITCRRRLALDTCPTCRSARRPPPPQQPVQTTDMSNNVMNAHITYRYDMSYNIINNANNRNYRNNI